MGVCIRLRAQHAIITQTECIRAVVDAAAVIVQHSLALKVKRCF